jgi:hydrophobe/amphiphile efflux-1 (HAE1) family protein
MRISDVSIRNPVFAWMLMAALITFGAISFSRMGVSQLPDVDFPVVNVSVTLEGAAPEIMETTVVDPLEDALSTVEGVRSITSTSRTGLANVTVEFELGRDINVALQEIQTKVAQAQRLLPNDVEPPVISKTNPDDQPILWLALTSEKADMEFMNKYARDYLKDRFTTIAGVGEVTLGGYTDPALRIWVKPKALTRFNIAVNDILDAIKTEHNEMPGGYVETAARNFNVRTMGEAKSVDEFKNIVISKRAGQNIADPSNMVKLGQVADVKEGLNDVRRLSRFNGQPALGLGIKKQRGSNAVAVAQGVKAKALELNSSLPAGMKISVNFDSTVFIEQSVHALVEHLMLAVLLTSIVCWMFLGSFTATFNVLLSIPTSIMGAFIGLYFAGFTLNTFTLLGLTLAIGIVVDDAIMVLENIFRYNEKGRGQVESAIIGAREITFAAIAASVAVIAIFLPVAFMKGIIGKFFLQFGVTISLAVFLSLVESLTITPMRCATFVHMSERTSYVGKAFENGLHRLRGFYERTLASCLNHRWIVLGISLAFVAASFFIVTLLRKEMVPLQDQSTFIARVQTPVGSSLAFTNDQMKKLESWFLNRGEIEKVYAAIGGFSGQSNDSNTGMMFVTMKDKDKRPRDDKKGRALSQQEFMDFARGEIRKIKDVKVFMQDLSQRGFGTGRGFPIELRVAGPDWEKLAEQSNKLMEAMRTSGLMTDVDSNYLLGQPEIQIIPDRVQAALHGISISAIGTTVNALIGGVKAGQYPKEGHRYDIRVKIEEDKDQVGDIKNLLVGNARSNLIPITQVTRQETKSSLQSVSRVDRQRAISVTANLVPGTSQQAALDFVFAKSKETLETNYTVEQTGSSKTFQESFDSLIFALIMGLAVAYMVLAAQFNSYIDPMAVLMALPFSFSGAFFALWGTGQSINIYSMIGILLLMGIVKKNSILLIEFTNTVRDRGAADARSALMEACPTRLRPILMTSMATIAAAIPSAVATGAGSETFKPMAITLIGGVFVSTLLTLYVVPCVYLLMDHFRRRDTARARVKEAFADVGDEALEA